MMNLFTPCKVTTLEAFKQSLYTKIKIFILMILLGFITLVVGLLPQFTNLLTLEDYASGFLTGFGTGLIILGIIFIIRTNKILKDEAKLKEERLKVQDERNLMICNHSIKVATFIVLITLYICLIASLFINRQMTTCFIIPIFVFLGSYMIANLYFSRRY